MGKNVIIAISVAFTLTLSLFIAFLYCRSWFSFITLSSDINPVEVLSLLISSTITIILAIYITKKLSEQRYEKEFLITDLKTLETEIAIVIQHTESSKELELNTAISLTNKLFSQLKRFERTTQVVGYRCKEAGLLKFHLYSLYMKLTNTESNFLKLEDANKTEITQICDDIIVETRKAIFTINNR